MLLFLDCVNMKNANMFRSRLLNLVYDNRYGIEKSLVNPKHIESLFNSLECDDWFKE